MLTNELYLVILPLVHITPTTVYGYGLTEETLTILPDRNFATAFFEEEVSTYIDIFRTRAEKYLTGGRVKSYQFSTERVFDGRVIVKVTQVVG